MSESLPSDEIAGLTKRIDDLANAIAELKAASTSREKQEAREDVSDAEKALKKYAESHGITLDEAEEAMNEVRSRNRSREIREAIKSFTKEDWEEIFPEETPDEEGKDSPKPTAVKEPKKPREEKPKEKEEDLAPAGDHWSDRKLW